MATELTWTVDVKVEALTWGEMVIINQLANVGSTNPPTGGPCKPGEPGWTIGAATGGGEYLLHPMADVPGGWDGVQTTVLVFGSNNKSWICPCESPCEIGPGTIDVTLKNAITGAIMLASDGEGDTAPCETDSWALGAGFPLYSGFPDHPLQFTGSTPVPDLELDIGVFGVNAWHASIQIYTVAMVDVLGPPHVPPPPPPPWPTPNPVDPPRCGFFSPT